MPSSESSELLVKRVEGDMTVHRAAGLKAALCGALDASAGLGLDLSGVTDFDTAGLQILLLLNNQAQAGGKTLRLDSLSAPVNEIFELFHLGRHFPAVSGRARAPVRQQRRAADMDQSLKSFVLESRERLADMETALLQVEQAPARGDLVNAIFRAAHTIKGSAGLFGLDHIVAFTHMLESVVDQVREGRMDITNRLVILMLSCSDHIGTLICEIEAGRFTASEDVTTRANSLIEQLRRFLISGAPANAADGASTARWHISLDFGADVLRHGMDPLLFIRYMTRLGRIVDVAIVPGQLPSHDEMDPETCYLGFGIVFESTASREKIESVFELVRDDCVLNIVKHDGQAPAERRGGANAAPALQADAAAAAKAAVSAIGTASVRVEADKLDHLINLVGELITACANVDLMAQRVQDPDLRESTSVLSGLVEEMRDSALQLRMVKIEGTFNRFQRVVFDVSRELDKDIRLVISGEETELDKTVVEKLADPLMHLVRNAIAHGIEAAHVRTQRGKPAQGTLRLNAFHDSGSIVIEVSDDGGGLKADRIFAKAVECGLIDAKRVMSVNEIHNLIFEPGISTAEQITNLSGRGVGMDVVKRNIMAMRGSIGLSSVEHEGTTVSIRLPLTLAIIDGFQVAVGGNVFVIPLDAIEECIEYAEQEGGDYLNLRGEILPFVRIRDFFRIDGRASSRESIVVVKHAGQRTGLVVDTLLGEFQMVIKPLGKMFNPVKCISGSSIMGSGEVALIVDVASLCEQIVSRQTHPVSV
ncbi:MAG TPA: chemotaxis protein CheW [Bordetella sp.]|uniref:chemotaxis protein CheW n=1 Tax=Bordetella sp. TaxID=28081 RepID=UPI002ED5AAEC